MILKSQTAKPYLLSAAAIFYCTALIVNAKAVSEGITDSVIRCINIIIPSLFAFMAVSGIIIKSGLYYYISKPFHFISKYVLRLPDNLFFIFILGNVCGYPIGIKLLSQMVSENKISAKSAEIMSCYCYAGGPAFLTGAVGLSVFGSQKVGLLIFVSVLICNILMAVILNRIYRISGDNTGEHLNLNSEIIINSAVDAGKSLFVMCILIVLFSTVMSVMESFRVFDFIAGKFNLSNNGLVSIKSFFEISSITRLTGAPYRFLPFITSLCGFGGLCVMLQITAVNSNMFSLKKFFITRPIFFVIQYIVSSAIFKLFSFQYIPAFSQNAQIIVDFNNFVPSICLIMMIFLLVLRKD
ncbi:nucleoside recognition protein [Ruminococcus sp. Marseille-P6503]|uniref:nucleoside recognition protein n=1 Tax=Ruminococcus sp. Marseille-P6503 TaxID=2364796 RepID=UPI000F539318|nr:nucleoside recognition protein [Ruminococcus sp. Marseille-P6503]